MKRVRAASTANEMAEDVAPLLLSLFEDGSVVGLEKGVELLGRSETVDGPLGVVEEEGEGFPRNVPDGLSVLGRFVFGRLVFVRVGGVLLLRLHSGLPPESR